jgi:hypothetical protein
MLYTYEQLLEIRRSTACNFISPSISSVLKKWNIFLLPSLTLKKRVRGKRSGKNVRDYKNRTAKSRECIGLATWNARSLNCKVDEVHDLIKDNGIDVLTLTETWHEDCDAASIRSLRGLGYSIVEEARKPPGGRVRDNVSWTNHGGVAILVGRGMRITKLKMDSFNHFECVGCRIVLGTKALTVINVYRPGSKNVTAAFFVEFRALLEGISVRTEPFIVTGDLNIRLDRPSSPHTAKFVSLLSDFDCTQWVGAPTHRDGGILDVIITRKEEKPLLIDVQDVGLSDHSMIKVKVNLRRPLPVYKKITSRAWRKLDLNAFRDDLRMTLGERVLSDRDTIEELLELYNTVLTSLANKYAPYTTKTLRARTCSDWFDEECRENKKTTRFLERQYRTLKTSDVRDAWIMSQKEYRKCIKAKKTQYWCDKVGEAKGNPRQLWKTLGAIVGAVPSEITTTLTAEKLDNHFRSKIERIREMSRTAPKPHISVGEVTGLSFFQHATVQEVEKLIMQAPNKQCELDPVPTWLIKECLKELLPVITAICNESMKHGTIPEKLKMAQITPIIKKPQLDPEDPASYRPVSNLPFLAKILEKLVTVRLTSYLQENDLFAKRQSAYRRLHSTETGMLRLISDLTLALEVGECALVALLDLSAAFDTVDHEILITKIEKCLGVTGKALQWFVAYISHRRQAVKLRNGHSSPSPLVSGVPQGSVLGPLLFTLYTRELEDIIEGWGLKVHIYADDCQIYSSCKPEDKDSLARSMDGCIQELKLWMSSHRLLLNPDKTEIMWMITSRRAHMFDVSPIAISGIDIVPSSCVKLLGIHLDSNISMKTQISQTVSSGYYGLRQIKFIARCLPLEARKTLINAFVVSKLDYCNSIYAGQPQCQLNRLQSVMNAAARLVYDKSKYSHITPLLRELHWLRVPQRIEYKLCSLTHRALHEKMPLYLAELIKQPMLNSRQLTLRSAENGAKTLVIEHLRKSATVFGERAFAVAAPRAWNQLTPEVQEIVDNNNFKKCLKTHLFAKSFRAPLE